MEVPLPSALLPSIRKIDQYSCEEIYLFVGLLGEIYTPEVLGTQLIFGTLYSAKANEDESIDKFGIYSAVDSYYASSTMYDQEREDEALSAKSLASFSEFPPRSTTSNSSNLREKRLLTIRADDFERAYALKWLTGLISRSEEWIDAGNDSEPGISGDSRARRENVVERACALVAACSGSTASGALTRSFNFNFRLPSSSVPELSVSAAIKLKDDAVPAQDHTAVGLQTWGSAPILAELICDSPPRFGLDIRGHPLLPRKILELGAGTGLLSLLLWRILDCQVEQIAPLLNPVQIAAPCSIIASDFHPEVLSNLRFNINLNPLPTIAESSVHDRLRPSLSVQPLDWTTYPTLDESDSYDVIFGADIVYEPEHAELVQNVVKKLLRKPWQVRSGEEQDPENERFVQGGIFWLIFPLRPTHDVEVKCIERIFGNEITSTPQERSPTTAGAEWDLGILDIQTLQRRKGIGRADEVSYRLLKIGWIPMMGRT
ncbi:hypothetical protein CPB86DRAFT_710768 [Serendipita vermifera]|nr:hypothetical protein CPB86DRAFT_710768 [Serendipita vermifera]